MEQPATAFTFEVLEDFEQHNLSSKKSAYDYHDALQKRTNSAFPQTVKDRYHEFNLASRVWQHLALERRSGQVHGIDDILKHWATRSLAVRCPACPEIDFNVDKATIDGADESETHKYTLFLSTDGNFRLQRKNKKDDPDDKALNEGHAYFVDVELYSRYLDFVDESDDKSTCAHLRAVRLQNIIKFVNAVISGVVAIQCARHGFYWPKGVVDLARGECFARTDYALAHAISDAENQRWIMLSYDIWCQYSKKLKARFQKHFPRIAPILSRLRGAVPKMHIKGHVLYCQLLWSFNYLPYSGETYGEGIESAWAEQNQTAGSTKEQNDGHRHDSLDAFFGYWNWTKSHQMGESLYRLYTNCIALLKKREENFKKLTGRYPSNVISKWESMDIAPKIVDKHVISVYEARIKNGPPTQKKAYDKLLREEHQNHLAGIELIGNAQFINTGLRLEYDQLKICQLVKAANDNSPTDQKAIQAARSKFQQEFRPWRRQQLSLIPSLQPEISSSTSAKPENEPLFLPSHLSQPQRSYFGMDNLASIEYSLREGQAHDALDSVRTTIQTFNYNLKFKTDNVRGQGANTRAQAYLKTLAADKVSSADKYRRARVALNSLGLSEKDQTLQPLCDDQLYCKDSSKPLKLGDAHKEDPWFWTVGRPSGMSSREEKEWNLEVDRVKWFRDRAACQRSREEKEILEEEFKRTIRSFERMAEVWNELGGKAPDKSGEAVYAFQQVSMYARLASGCETLFMRALLK